jgi:hypothetical protein
MVTASVKSEVVVYVYAPNFVTWSAGIRVLHLLCHELNSSGIKSYLVLHGPRNNNDSQTNSKWNTPILTKDIHLNYISRGICPIVIYPESISGNPLQSCRYIKWLLNFPGLLGGPHQFENEFVIPYSEAIALKLMAENGIYLKPYFLPPLDILEIESALEVEADTRERYEVVYAEKFQSLGGKIQLKPRQKQITRFSKNSSNRVETLQIIRNASCIHVYENSTVITEAILLGTPVYCHKNKYFDEMIARFELGEIGCSWDSVPNLDWDPEELRNAYRVATSHSINNIEKILIPRLKLLICTETCQNFRFPKQRLIQAHSISRFLALLQQNGFKVACRYVYNYLRRYKR